MNEATINSSIERYYCLLKLCDYAQNRAKSDPAGSFARAIELPLSGRKIRDKKIGIDRYFNELQQYIIDYSFLDMVAAFEKTIFIKFGNASGDLKKIVKKEYIAPKPFYMSAESFIKNRDDIYNLSGLKKILDGKIPSELSESLSEIIEHRNWIAHGKRVGKQSTLKIEEVHNIIEKILNIILSKDYGP